MNHTLFFFLCLFKVLLKQSFHFDKTEVFSRYSCHPKLGKLIWFILIASPLTVFFSQKGLPKLWVIENRNFACLSPCWYVCKSFTCSRVGDRKSTVGFSEGHGGTWYRVTCNPPRISLWLLHTDVWWSKQTPATPASHEISTQAFLTCSRFMAPESKDSNTHLMAPVTYVRR